jgi:carboxymethylenebutenolidase
MSMSDVDVESRGLLAARWGDGVTGPGRPDLAGVIGFHGRPETAEATADAHIPPESTQVLAAQLRAAGAIVTRVVFDGAPHSFFDRTAGDHTAACTGA